MGLILIHPVARERDEVRLTRICETAGVLEKTTEKIETAAGLQKAMAPPAVLRGKRILFAVALGETGVNLEYYRMLDLIRRSPRSFEGSCAAMLIDGAGEDCTKAVARELALSLSGSGCLVIGKPLVEGTGSLKNFLVLAGQRSCSLETAYGYAVKELTERLLSFRPPRGGGGLLCVHASQRDNSNTYCLWQMVRRAFPEEADIREISLREKEVRDCAGCSFETCLHYGQESSCYYGGRMVEEVYPALSECRGLLLLCPNYNDAVGADLTAFINRLTALFRQRPFFDKYLYGIIVSGYSGGDLVADQLVGALTMNKAFILPPHFALMETANAPGSIRQAERIHQKAMSFGRQIAKTLGLSEGY